MKMGLLRKGYKNLGLFLLTSKRINSLYTSSPWAAYFIVWREKISRILHMNLQSIMQFHSLFKLQQKDKFGWWDMGGDIQIKLYVYTGSLQLSRIEDYIFHQWLFSALSDGTYRKTQSRRFVSNVENLTKILWHEVWKPEYFIARQQLCKQVPEEVNTHATTEEPVSKQWIGKHTTIGVLLETVFPIRYV
jgi:hypothetical protein